MSLYLRILLILCPIALVIYVIRKIRRSGMRTEDSVSWILFSAVLMLLGLFPRIPIRAAELLGIESPANFVFLAVIALLILQLFSVSVKLSRVEADMRTLVSEAAISEKEARRGQEGKNPEEN